MYYSIICEYRSKISTEDILSIGECVYGPSIVAIKVDNTPDSANKISKNESDWYIHSRCKIFFIESGFVHVTTTNGSWVLHSNRTGWIPPNKTNHKIRISGLFSGWMIFIAPRLCEDLSKSSHVIPMNEVLRALTLRATQWMVKGKLAE